MKVQQTSNYSQTKQQRPSFGMIRFINHTNIPAVNQIGRDIILENKTFRGFKPARNQKKLFEGTVYGVIKTLFGSKKEIELLGLLKQNGFMARAVTTKEGEKLLGGIKEETSKAFQKFIEESYAEFKASRKSNSFAGFGWHIGD